MVVVVIVERDVDLVCGKLRIWFFRVKVLDFEDGVFEVVIKY